MISKLFFLWLMLLVIVIAAISLPTGTDVAHSQLVPLFGVEPVEPGAMLPGLDYAYYEIDASFESQLPVKTGHVTNVDIGLNERETNYAFQFSGYIQISATSIYTFIVDSTDTVRITINEQAVVTHTGNTSQPSAETIDLAEGYYRLRIDYSHVDTLSPSLAISWSSIVMPPQDVPDNVLFRDDPSAVATITPTDMPSPTPTSASTPEPSNGGTTTFLPTSTPTALPQVTQDELDQYLYLPSLLQPVSDKQFITFVSLSDGDTVTSPFDIEMTAANFDIETAGAIREGAGHFHLMVDVPCIEPGQQIPNDDNHRHYGDGATNVTLDLSVGPHTLCLQAGNGVHTALDLTQEVNITVVAQDLEQRVSFSQPAAGTVLNGRVDVRMAAKNFVIEPAGAEIVGRGHFHIIIDSPCIGAGNEIPRDETHLHFGQGQTETELELAPGVHTLCLQAGTGFHTALRLTQLITITVQPEPQVTFLQPQNSATVINAIESVMGTVTEFKK